MLAHSVFFSLHDNSPAEIRAMVDACKKYLADHPGVIFFAAGTLNHELTRPVNDRDFDVALHVVFDSKAAHDAYQVAASHQQFIAENKPNWRLVRVFDADVEPN
jgi:heme-degrading monooxygenase HmoA